MHSKIAAIVEDMGDEQKAKLAGEILAEIDPTRTNFEAFFEAVKAVDETVYGELCSRAAALDD